MCRNFLLIKIIKIIFESISDAGIFVIILGGLAQLARALAWHARGHRFDSGIFHPVRILVNLNKFTR